MNRNIELMIMIKSQKHNEAFEFKQGRKTNRYENVQTIISTLKILKFMPKYVVSFIFLPFSVTFLYSLAFFLYLPHIVLFCTLAHSIFDTFLISSYIFVRCRQLSPVVSFLKWHREKLWNTQYFQFLNIYFTILFIIIVLIVNWCNMSEPSSKDSSTASKTPMFYICGGLYRLCLERLMIKISQIIYLDLISICFNKKYLIFTRMPSRKWNKTQRSYPLQRMWLPNNVQETYKEMYPFILNIGFSQLLFIAFYFKFKLNSKISKQSIFLNIYVVIVFDARWRRQINGRRIFHYFISFILVIKYNVI